MNTITITNATPASIVIANNTSSDVNLSRANFPPNAPLDFGSLAKMFTSLTPQSSPPATPNAGDVYLDDGTNTASGTLGLRLYNGAAWVDFGLQSGSGAFGRIDDLTNVEITGVSNGDRVVYDAVSGKWKNVNVIDGGTFE